jgi:hypothetical protein
MELAFTKNNGCRLLNTCMIFLVMAQEQIREVLKYGLLMHPATGMPPSQTKTPFSGDTNPYVRPTFIRNLTRVGQQIYKPGGKNMDAVFMLC